MGVVDYSLVDPGHAEIDRRLVNWARWLVSGRGQDVHPMFRGFVSSEQWGPVTHSVPLDPLDAQRIEKAVQKLPEKHRAAVRWSYVFRTSPLRMARKLGESMEGLRVLVVQSRTMLLNNTAARDGINRPAAREYA